MNDEPNVPTQAGAPPCPITGDQLSLVEDACRLVAASPARHGVVIIQIENGETRFIMPAPSLDARPMPISESRLWLWDRTEAHTERRHR